MKKEIINYLSSDGITNIMAIRWLPDREPSAVLQISHGMVEFIERYEDFARFMTDKGFVVTGNDHLGHGDSVNSRDDWGYFGDNGDKLVLDDLYSLTRLTKEAFPDLPYFLLGHSMGSFFARKYLIEHGSELNGAIIMGTGNQPKALALSGMGLCRVIAAFKGWRYRSPLVNSMVLGGNNRKFEPSATHFDWLSRDEEVVQKYIHEPRNTFVFTLNGFYSMLKVISELHDKEKLRFVPKQLPVLFVSGKDDPVGEFGKGVSSAYEELKSAGHNRTDIMLFDGYRHEILNETDKELVYNYLYDYLYRLLSLR